MPNHNSSQNHDPAEKDEPTRKGKSNSKSLKRFKRKFRNATGFSFDSVVRPFSLVAIIIGIVLLALFISSRQTVEPSGIEAVETKRLTAEEQFIEISRLPENFSQKLPVEQIDILQSKIAAGEELASSGGDYAERAKDQLVLIYGSLCQMQDLLSIKSEKTNERLTELRTEALEAGNKDRVAQADYLLAVSATGRLIQNTEQSDFRFATDAVQNLDSKRLVNAQYINGLYLNAIKLHNISSNKDRTADFLNTLGAKLADSPVRGVSQLGLNLKDHARYARFYAAIAETPYTTRESKLQFFREMLAAIEEHPPQSRNTYQIALRLIDRLLNKSEGFFAGTLTERLRKTASNARPTIKAGVEKAIDNIKTRLAAIGRTADLSGSSFRGSPLQLPNGKPTRLLFYQIDHEPSQAHLKSIANSNRFNPWGTNMLVAFVSNPSVEELKNAANEIGNFTLLDSATSSRLRERFAIDILPYQVSLDEDGKVIRLGVPTD